MTQHPGGRGSGGFGSGGGRRGSGPGSGAGGGTGVLVVVFDGVQSLDVTGPVEVFTGAGLAAADPEAYVIRTASPDGGPVRTSSGLTLLPDFSLADAPVPHTLLVPGGHPAQDAGVRLACWLREHAPHAERLVSV